MLRFMGSQRFGSDWMTELNLTAPWKERYDKPRQHIKKQRHHFPNKSPSSQSYGFAKSEQCFQEVMCGCESWTIKKADHRKIDAFEL